MHIRVPRSRRREALGQTSPMRIHLELQFLVLDQFSDDDIELRRLCSICQAWGTYAQGLIFREVWVKSATVQRLLLLFQRRPHLGTCVRTLRVVDASTERWLMTVLELLVEHLPDMMPNAHTLDIIGRNFGTDISHLESSAHKLAYITHLRLRGDGRLINAYKMLRFMSLFPRLEGLEILGHSPISEDAVILSPIPPRHLRYLCLGMIVCSRTLVESLASCLVGVDNLRISAWGHDDDHWVPFLRQIGDGLRHLRLEEIRSRSSSDKITIPSLPKLQSLEIDLRFSIVNRRSMDIGLLAVLNQLSGVHLSTMYFETFVMTEHLDLQWDEVDVVLKGFISLREVIFDLYGYLNVAGGRECGGGTEALTYSELCDGMKRKMPYSNARGILKFKCAGRSTLLTAT
ncbi:hypothetical protein B0H19DRAFT_1374215 [Mycena capillaripes]|nr:hypothetical protein B0H19DRAFT_1374215 [Mycena capillaripes]